MILRNARIYQVNWRIIGIYTYLQAADIFEDIIEDDEELQRDYAASVGNCLERLKSDYKEKIRQLKETGGKFPK